MGVVGDEVRAAQAREVVGDGRGVLGVAGELARGDETDGSGEGVHGVYGRTGGEGADFFDEVPVGGLEKEATGAGEGLDDGTDTFELVDLGRGVDVFEVDGNVVFEEVVFKDASEEGLLGIGFNAKEGRGVGELDFFDFFNDGRRGDAVGKVIEDEDASQGVTGNDTEGCAGLGGPFDLGGARGGVTVGVGFGEERFIGYVRDLLQCRVS